jgi:hypothetical protein
MVASTGGANSSVSTGLQGVQATGVAGNIRVSIQNDTPTGGVIVAGGQTEARFLDLLGRVTATTRGQISRRYRLKNWTMSMTSLLCLRNKVLFRPPIQPS